MRGTHDVDDSIQVLETSVLEHPRIHVVLEMMVVDAKPDHVEAHVPECRGIRIGEEILQELHRLVNRASSGLHEQSRASLTLSKKKSYRSRPNTLSRPARIWSCIHSARFQMGRSRSCAGYPVMKFSMHTEGVLAFVTIYHVLQPPRHAPLRRKAFPRKVMSLPLTWRISSDVTVSGDGAWGSPLLDLSTQPYPFGLYGSSPPVGTANVSMVIGAVYNSRPSPAACTKRKSSGRYERPAVERKQLGRHPPATPSVRSCGYHVPAGR